MLLFILTIIGIVYVASANYSASKNVPKAYQSAIQKSLFAIYALCIMVSIAYAYRNAYDEIVSTRLMMMVMLGIPAMLVGVLVSSVTVAMTVRRQLPAEIEIMPDGSCKFEGKTFLDKIEAIQYYERAMKRKGKPNKTL